jgi:hypothetical protein
MVNKWVEHIRAFAKKNDLTYGCALSDPKCKSSYHASKAPAKAPEPPAKAPERKAEAVIGDFIENAIKDIFYSDFPDFMKTTVSKDKVYRDKFLTKSATEQSKIRAMVRAKLIKSGVIKR